MEFAKSLDNFIRNSQETNASLAEKITAMGKKISQESIAKYRRGERTPNPEMIEYICEALGIHEQDLFSNAELKKEKIAIAAIRNPSDKIKTYLTASGYGTDRVKEIDLYDGYVGGGSTGEIEDGVNSFYIDKYVIDKPYRDKKIHAIRVIGDSMVPYISEGDIALYIDVEDGEQLSDGKYIIDTVHGKMLKNLKFHLDGSVTISSENEKYRPERVSRGSQESFAIVGRVVGRILKS